MYQQMCGHQRTEAQCWAAHATCAWHMPIANSSAPVSPPPDAAIRSMFEGPLTAVEVWFVGTLASGCFVVAAAFAVEEPPR